MDKQMVTVPYFSNSNGLTAPPTATGGIARAAYERCVQEGIRADNLLRKAGLTRRQIENPEVRLTVQSQIKFLDLAGAALRDQLLGFHLAQALELRELGLLYYVMASSDLLGDALQRAAHYSAIVNEGVRLSYRAGEHVTIDFNYTGVQRHLDRHQIEFFMTTVIRLCRQLTGHQLRPQGVTLTHLRTNVSDEIKKYFGRSVVFGGTVDRVAFANVLRHMPVRSADPYLNTLLLKYCDEARRDRASKSSPLRMSVENVIVPLLPHEKINSSKIAGILGLSRRTLARHLMSQGLSLTVIVHDLRRDLARRYLGETGISISTIAWLLGYSEVSSFTHAFKRWTGKTPKEVRLREAQTAIRG
jgi:AraC-like DNA-binding protein